MKNLRRLTSLQLVMTGCGASTVAGVMLSHEKKMGFMFLALALASGIGAFASAKSS